MRAKIQIFVTFSHENYSILTQKSKLTIFLGFVFLDRKCTFWTLCMTCWITRYKVNNLSVKILGKAKLRKAKVTEFHKFLQFLTFFSSNSKGKNSCRNWNKRRNSRTSRISLSDHSVWKSQKKSHSKLRVKRATFNFGWTKVHQKCQKWSIWRVFENMKLAVK